MLSGKDLHGEEHQYPFPDITPLSFHGVGAAESLGTITRGFGQGGDENSDTHGRLSGIPRAWAVVDDEDHPGDIAKEEVRNGVFTLFLLGFVLGSS